MDGNKSTHPLLLTTRISADTGQTAATAAHDSAGGDGNGRGAKQESVGMLIDNEDVKTYIRNCRAYDVRKYARARQASAPLERGERRSTESSR